MSKNFLVSIALLAIPVNMSAIAGTTEGQSVQADLDSFKESHKNRTFESCVTLGNLATEFLKQSNNLSPDEIKSLAGQFKLETERLDCNSYQEAANFLVNGEAGDADLFSSAEPADLTEVEAAAQKIDASLEIKGKFIGGVGKAVGGAIGGAVVSKVVDGVLDAAIPAMQANGGKNQLADFAQVAQHGGIGYMGWTKAPARVEFGVPKPDKRLAIAESEKVGPASDTEFDW